jgi:hypothetical protein
VVPSSIAHEIIVDTEKAKQSVNRKKNGEWKRPLTAVKLHKKLPNLYHKPAKPSSLESALPRGMSAKKRPGSFLEVEEELTNDAEFKGEAKMESPRRPEIVPTPPAISIRTTRSAREVRCPKEFHEWAEIALMVNKDPGMPSVVQPLSEPETGE